MSPFANVRSMSRCLHIMRRQVDTPEPMTLVVGLTCLQTSVAAYSKPHMPDASDRAALQAWLDALLLQAPKLRARGSVQALYHLARLHTAPGAWIEHEMVKQLLVVLHARVAEFVTELSPRVRSSCVKLWNLNVW